MNAIGWDVAKDGGDYSAVWFGSINVKGCITLDAFVYLIPVKQYYRLECDVVIQWYSLNHELKAEIWL